MKPSSLAASVFALAAGFSSCPAAAQQRYSVQSLGPFQAEGMGDDGTVAGTTGNKSYAWNSAYGTVRLPGLIPTSSVLTWDVNDSGEVVGYCDLDNGPRRAVIWDHENGTREFYDFGRPYAEAGGINNRGQIVGRYGTFFDSKPYIWSPSTGFRQLPELFSGFGASPEMINDDGDAAGYAGRPDGGVSGVIWHEGTVEDIGQFPGQEQTTPADLNNQGTMTGICFGALGQVGYVRYADKSWERIPNPLNAGYSVYGTGLNEKNEVAGRLVGLDNKIHGFVWSHEGGTRVVNDLLLPEFAGWDVILAQDIDNFGRICGAARDPSGTFHGVLLTPVPEPPAFVLLGAGVLGLALRRKRTSP